MQATVRNADALSDRGAGGRRASGGGGRVAAEMGRPPSDIRPGRRSPPPHITRKQRLRAAPSGSCLAQLLFVCDRASGAAGDSGPADGRRLSNVWVNGARPYLGSSANRFPDGVFSPWRPHLTTLRSFLRLVFYDAAGPYIPSYMDANDVCVVCSDVATGYHYRCMTCEGCKGFFRRTIQRSLSYTCKGSGNCSVDKSTRNQCQQCRYDKCVRVGMAVDLVLNENQRTAKKQLIKENRERKEIEKIREHLKATAFNEPVTDEDRSLVASITESYCRTIDGERSVRTTEPHPAANWQSVITPLIKVCIDFAKGVPLFRQLNTNDQKVLMGNCCWLELLLLHISQQYDEEHSTLILASGRGVGVEELKKDAAMGALLLPLLRFSAFMCRLQMDNSEVALVAALLILNPDREELTDSQAVEQAEERILIALRRNMRKGSDSPDQMRLPKLMLNVANLRAIAGNLQNAYCDLQNSHLLAEIFGIPCAHAEN
uniref:Uncharacterized protein n=1 Tax=Plectus sambesii TaxID=2011161 RepID=A0A914UZP3_9BILA